MRFLACFVGLVLSASLTVSVVNARKVQSDRPTDGYWRCFSGPENDPMYFTGVWEERAHGSEVQAAFVKFLADKYGYTGRVSCSTASKGASDLTKAKAASVDLQRQYQTQGKKVIDTGWTHGVPSASAAAVQPAVIWAACRMGVPKAGMPITRRPELRMYLSDATPRSGARDELEVAAAFAAFVRAQYALTGGSAQCVTTRTESDAQKSLKGFEDEAAKYQHELVRTGWKFTPAKPAVAPVTPTPPAPVAAAPPTARPTQAAAVSVLHAICYGDVDPATKYYSAVFDGTKGDYADWMPAFQKYLEQTHKYRGFVRCNKQPSQAAAEKYRDDLIARSRGATLPGGAKVTIVETGWSYK